MGIPVKDAIYLTLNLKVMTVSQKAKKELELHHRKAQSAFEMMKSDAAKKAQCLEVIRLMW